MLYYSKNIGGFFDDAIHDVLPADVVEITPEQHRQLLDGQCNGMIIAADESGYPVSIDPKSLLTLDGLKDLRWRDVKHLRDQHIDGGCDVPGIGRFDTDPVSRANITGAVTGAFMAKSAGEAFAINWKLADNDLIQLDADQMILVGETVLVHVSTCHARSQALGLAIAAAASKEELDAIAIEQGWPA